MSGVETGPWDEEIMEITLKPLATDLSVRTFHARIPLAFPIQRTCSTKWNLSLNAVDMQAGVSGPVKDQSKRKVFETS